MMPALASGSNPTAMQVVASGQLMPYSPFAVPDGRETHDFPAVEVDRMVPALPTARQLVALGQLIPSRFSYVGGTSNTQPTPACVAAAAGAATAAPDAWRPTKPMTVRMPITSRHTDRPPAFVMMLSPFV